MISLEEGSSPKNKTNSIIGKLFNTFNKMGKGLRNIMSMKIEYINDDINPNNLYAQNQIKNNNTPNFNNNFNNNNNINIPSLMEESHNSFNNINYNKNSNENNSNMQISSFNIDNNNSNYNNCFNNVNNNEKFIFLQKDNNNSNNQIKSTLLSKKRNSESKIDNILKEDKINNDDSEVRINFNSINVKEKNSLIDENEQQDANICTETKNKMNTPENKSKINNNTSLISMSIKSLDNIKSEISQRRDENLKNISEMYGRHGLYYNYEKEFEMRQKIMEEYYRNKAQKIAEITLKMAKDKKSREEEYKKLKIKKVKELKYQAFKKPKIFKETKNNQIEFLGKQNTQTNCKNIVKLTFGKIKNEDNNSLDNNFKQKDDKIVDAKNDSIKKIENDNTNINNSLFGFNDNIDKNKKENEFKKEDNQIPSLFGTKTDKPELNKQVDSNQISLFNIKTNNKTDDKIDEKQKTAEKKTESITTNNLFSNINALNSSNSLFNNQESKSLFQTDNKVKSEGTVLFTGNIIFGKDNTNDKIGIFGVPSEKKTISLFSSKDKNSNDGLFFNSIKTTNVNNKDDNEKNKQGLFNQETQVSSGINSKPLFVSNQEEKKQEGSLITENNPFLKSSSNPPNNLFQSSIQNNNNVINTNFSFGGRNSGGNLFGNTTSLFGNSKGIFG